MSSTHVKVSAEAARRISLAAQGFAEPRPTGRVDRRHVRRLIHRLGVIQIDSVTVLARSQELPLFARLGPHRRDLLPTLADSNEIFEYWGHAASLLPVEMFPLFKWRMDIARERAWSGLVELTRDRPDYVEAVYNEVRDRGPISAGELVDPGEKSGPWWGWRHGKRALEFLFWAGRVSARRRPNFERVYDLTERVLPKASLDAAVPDHDEAVKSLLTISARSCGLGTANDLADYYRIKLGVARQLLQELVEEGTLLNAQVEGWREPGFLHPEATMPRRVNARALLSPFDSLVWERARTERVFNFHYRIEIYTPAEKRVFGYYVLPFLLGDELVARVDLKADRALSTLRVRGAFVEPGKEPKAIAGPLAEELQLMAGWLGLEAIEVYNNGDLSRALRRCI